MNFNVQLAGNFWRTQDLSVLCIDPVLYRHSFFIASISLSGGVEKKDGWDYKIVATGFNRNQDTWVQRVEGLSKGLP